jgi:CAAX protease family protein
MPRVIVHMASPIPPIPAASTPIQRKPSESSSLNKIFIGSNGLRSGWRVLLFYALLAALVFTLVVAIRAIKRALWAPPQVTTIVTPGRAFLNEGILLFAVLFAAFVFARFERRGFADYGLPLRGAFIARFLEGLLWGFALMSFVLLVLRATGNFYFGSIALRPEKIATFAILWAVIFVMVGVAEGFAFSGYPLFALARGLGFWPAAALLALLFGALHLAANGGENWLGSLSLVIVGLLLAFTIQRTGNLWFAIGIHAAWDWAQSFLYGVPDSGVLFTGHLFNPSFHGSKWMTGGTAGPEASIVTLPGYLFVFALVHFRFPKRGITAQEAKRG